MPSIYHTLPQGAIRLLTLHPRQASSLVSCSLTIHSFNDEASMPSYIALSYVWGPEKPTFDILINGEKVTIRENLYSFLLQIMPYDDLPIWIDALCINQQDNPERSHQVRFMGSIYSQAQMVWAWLGSAQDLELRNALLELRENPSKYIYDVDLEGDPSGFDKLDTLAQNDYWGRAWVVQEFLLAKKVHVVYGDVQIDPGSIDSLMNSHRRNNKFLALYKIHGESPDQDWSAVRIPFEWSHQQSLMYSLCEQRASYVPMVPWGGALLMYLLGNNSERECLESRDKIYSLLNLAFGPYSRGEKCDIDVDYDADVTSVFLSVMNGIRMRSNMVFHHASLLKRVLKIDAKLPIQTEGSKKHEEKCKKVQAFFNGEVMEVLDLSNEVAEDEHNCGVLDSSSIPSLLARLGKYKSAFSPKSRDHYDWMEEWLIKRSYWKNESSVSDSSDSELSDISTLQRVSPGKDCTSEKDRETGRIALSTQLSELRSVQPNHLKQISTLAENINRRCFPQVEQSPNQPNAADTNLSKLALVVLRFSTNLRTSPGGKGNSTWTHKFEAKYILGLSHGKTSVSDKIIGFPDAMSGFAFSLSEHSRKYLTGAIRWVDSTESHTFEGPPHAMNEEADCRDNGNFFAYAKGTGYDYIYPSIDLKMTAEEIFGLTPVEVEN